MKENYILLAIYKILYE